MGLEILLGRYSTEQTEVLRKINRDDSFALHEFENRGGFWKAGEKWIRNMIFFQMKKKWMNIFRRVWGDC